MRFDRANNAAGHDETERVDRIRRIGRNDHIARRGDRLREIGEAFLRAKRRNDLRIGIELHAEAPIVITRHRAAQPRYAARGRIAIGARLGRRLAELVDDMLRHRQIRIAHAEVDNVHALDCAGAPSACSPPRTHTEAGGVSYGSRRRSWEEARRSVWFVASARLFEIASRASSRNSAAGSSWFCSPVRRARIGASPLGQRGNHVRLSTAAQCAASSVGVLSYSARTRKLGYEESSFSDAALR